MTSFMTHYYQFVIKILNFTAFSAIWAQPRIHLKILKLRRFFGDIGKFVVIGPVIMGLSCMLYKNLIQKSSDNGIFRLQIIEFVIKIKICFLKKCLVFHIIIKTYFEELRHIFVVHKKLMSTRLNAVANLFKIQNVNLSKK